MKDTGKILDKGNQSFRYQFSKSVSVKFIRDHFYIYIVSVLNIFSASVSV